MTFPEETQNTAVVVEREIVGEDVLARALLERLQQDDVAINRQAVQRAEGVLEVLELTRSHPEIYVVGGAREDVDHALRSAMFDIALRLQISENEVLSLLCTAETARDHLPLLWEQARNGFVGMRFVEAAALGALHLRAPVGPTRRLGSMRRRRSRSWIVPRPNGRSRCRSPRSGGG